MIEMASQRSRSLLFLMCLIPIFTRTECISQFTKSGNLAPLYEVNLDTPPVDRWVPVLDQIDAQALKSHMKDTVLDLMRFEAVQTFAAAIANQASSFMEEEYLQELEGISMYLDLDLGNVVIYNYFYELVSRSRESPTNTNRSSTSIVTNCKNNGIIHAQNVEADDAEFLKTITVNIDFKKGGQVIYTGTTFVGSIGLQNGFKPDLFTMSVNQRNSGNLFDVLVCALRRATPLFVVTRQLLENAENFDDAVLLLTREKAIAPYYFILGGSCAYQGAVVVGDRGSVSGVALMNSSLEYEWFVLQTNYDPWTTPPILDNRRAIAVAGMETVGQASMTPLTLKGVTSIPIVLNQHTVFTTIMGACRRSIYKTIIR